METTTPLYGNRTPAPAIDPTDAANRLANARFMTALGGELTPQLLTDYTHALTDLTPDGTGVNGFRVAIGCRCWEEECTKPADYDEDDFDAINECYCIDCTGGNYHYEFCPYVTSWEDCDAAEVHAIADTWEQINPRRPDLAHWQPTYTATWWTTRYPGGPLEPDEYAEFEDAYLASSLIDQIHTQETDCIDRIGYDATADLTIYDIGTHLLVHVNGLHCWGRNGWWTIAPTAADND